MMYVYPHVPEGTGKGCICIARIRLPPLVSSSSSSSLRARKNNSIPTRIVMG